MNIESYKVKYWFQKSDGYFEQREKIYYCNSKNGHNKIKKQFEKVIFKTNIKF